MQACDMPLRRADPRSETPYAQVHGILTAGQGLPQTPFALWDISDHGLRLWVPEPLRRGLAIKATVAKPFVLLIEGEVRWCRAATDLGGYFVGLQVLANFARLESLHAQVLASSPPAVAADGERLNYAPLKLVQPL
jgi:hypothetical protein